MDARVDFSLNGSFGVIERTIFRLVLNGASSAVGIAGALAIFSDSVIAAAIERLVCAQLLAADLESGTLRITDSVAALAAACHDRTIFVEMPERLRETMGEEGAIVVREPWGYDENGAAKKLNAALLKELMPGVELGPLAKALNFYIYEREDGEGDE